MLLEFRLSMPNMGSWNGQWTGEKNCHAKILNFTQRYGKSAKAEEKVNGILKNKDFYYNFGDGWGMNISVKEVDSKEAAKTRRKSVGFCGYEWAIESIVQYGEILNELQRKESK